MVEWQGTLSKAPDLFLLLLVFIACTLFQRICVGSIIGMSVAETILQQTNSEFNFLSTR